MTGASATTVEEGLRLPPASLAAQFFGSVVEVKPHPGSAVLCNHCDAPSFRVINDCIVVVSRHHGNYHKTVVSLADLGYVRAK